MPRTLDTNPIKMVILMLNKDILDTGPWPNQHMPDSTETLEVHRRMNIGVREKSITEMEGEIPYTTKSVDHL